MSKFPHSAKLVFYLKTGLEKLQYMEKIIRLIGQQLFRRRLQKIKKNDEDNPFLIW